MLEPLLWIIGFLSLWGLFCWVIIRADTKAEEAYKRWYDHPDQIWNRWKNEDS